MGPSYHIDMCTPTKYLLKYDTRYIIKTPICYELKIFKWLRANGGLKGIDWSSQESWTTHEGTRIIQFEFANEDTEALFKLTFGDHFIEVPSVKYVNLFSRPLFDRFTRS
jgi:hypothetical protein